MIERPTLDSRLLEKRLILFGSSRFAGVIQTELQNCQPKDTIDDMDDRYYRIARVLEVVACFHLPAMRGSRVWTPDCEPHSVSKFRV